MGEPSRQSFNTSNRNVVDGGGVGGASGSPISSDLDTARWALTMHALFLRNPLLHNHHQGDSSSSGGNGNKSKPPAHHNTTSITQQQRQQHRQFLLDRRLMYLIDGMSTPLASYTLSSLDAQIRHQLALVVLAGLLLSGDPPRPDLIIYPPTTPSSTSFHRYIAYTSVI